MQAQVPRWNRVPSILAGSFRANRRWLALAALLAALTTLHLFSLVRTPPPFVDDAWYASRAWALIRDGRPFSGLDAGVLDRYPGYWTYFPWLGPLLQSLVLRILGLSLFSVRLASLLFGLALVGIVFFIAKRLSGPRVGLLTVLLVALSRPFLQSAHLGRPDIVAAAFGYAAIALYLADGDARLPYKSVLAGLLFGLAFEIHPNAMIYAPAVAALLLVDHGRAVLRARRLWGLIAGASLGLLLYLAVHILRYPQTYLAITRIIVGSSRTPPILVPDPRAWLTSLWETALLLAWGTDLRAPLVVAACVSLARAGTHVDRRIVALFATLTLSLAMLVSNKASYYTILISPAADLLVAAFLVELYRRWRSALHQRPPIAIASGFLGLLACGLVLASIARGLPPAFDDPQRDYQASIDFIRQAVPPGESILGSQTYWLGMPDQPYSSWENLVYSQHYTPGSTVEDAFAELHPDYLVMDGYVDRLVADEAELSDPYYRFVAVSRTELERFLSRRANLVGSLTTRTFGCVRVYRIDWD